VGSVPQRIRAYVCVYNCRRTQRCAEMLWSAGLFRLRVCTRVALFHFAHDVNRSTLFCFWATMDHRCKTIRPMLSVRCLFVLSAYLSVTLVYLGQTVEWIKMKLGKDVDHGPEATLC